jgi:hypothetical protein
MEHQDVTDRATAIVRKALEQCLSGPPKLPVTLDLGDGATAKVVAIKDGVAEVEVTLPPAAKDIECEVRLESPAERVADPRLRYVSCADCGRDWSAAPVGAHIECECGYAATMMRHVDGEKGLSCTRRACQVRGATMYINGHRLGGAVNAKVAAARRDEALDEAFGESQRALERMKLGLYPFVPPDFNDVPPAPPTSSPRGTRAAVDEVLRALRIDRERVTEFPGELRIRGVLTGEQRAALQEVVATFVRVTDEPDHDPAARQAAHNSAVYRAKRGWR